MIHFPYPRRAVITIRSVWKIWITWIVFKVFYYKVFHISVCRYVHIFFFFCVFTHLEWFGSSTMWSSIVEILDSSWNFVFRFSGTYPLFLRGVLRWLAFLTSRLYCWFVEVTVLLTVSVKHLVIQRGTRRMTGQRRWWLNSFLTHLVISYTCLLTPLYFPFNF
jgi:hypothetical protein